MAENFKSFKKLIRKLESIDIQDLFEKTQAINIEDIKNIQWEKFFKSNLFFTVISILTTLFSINFLLIPTIKKSNNIKSQARLYVNESKQLNLLNKKVSESIFLKDNLEIQIQEISKLLINKNSLILIPRILNEAAKTSNISLIEISPIQSNQISCFYSQENRLNIDPELNPDKNIPMEKNILERNEIIKDSFELNENQTISFNRSKVFNKRLRSLFTKKSNQISNIFKSNFYKITLNGNYLDSLTFLKQIQEYNVIIYPVCFEPKSTFSANIPNRGINVTRFKNKLNIKLIINVPTN